MKPAMAAGGIVCVPSHGAWAGVFGEAYQIDRALLTQRKLRRQCCSIATATSRSLE